MVIDRDLAGGWVMQTALGAFEFGDQEFIDEQLTAVAKVDGISGKRRRRAQGEKMQTKNHSAIVRRTFRNSSCPFSEESVLLVSSLQLPKCHLQPSRPVRAASWDCRLEATGTGIQCELHLSPREHFCYATV